VRFRTDRPHCSFVNNFSDNLCLHHIARVAAAKPGVKPHACDPTSRPTTLNPFLRGRRAGQQGSGSGVGAEVDVKDELAQAYLVAVAQHARLVDDEPLPIEVRAV